MILEDRVLFGLPQAAGFIPGDADVQPSHNRPTTLQAAGFTPGDADLSNLHLV